jgi:hypothetical protein
MAKGINKKLKEKSKKVRPQTGTFELLIISVLRNTIIVLSIFHIFKFYKILPVSWLNLYCIYLKTDN